MQSLQLVALPSITNSDIGKLHAGAQAVVVDPTNPAPGLATVHDAEPDPANILVTHHRADFSSHPAVTASREWTNTTMSPPCTLVMRDCMLSFAHTLKRVSAACALLTLAACANLGDGKGRAPSMPGHVEGVPDASTVSASSASPGDPSMAPVAPRSAMPSSAPTSPSEGATGPSAATITAAGDAPATDAVAEPIDPLRPDVRVNLEDRSARLDLWTRVRQGFRVGNLDGDIVRKAERMYASQPDYVQRMTERGGRYLFHIVEEVQRRNLPTELALLPFVESAFNPEALSHASASGMWQFMPATGRVFNLKQNVFRDDRRDVLASTRAALDYLVKLHGMFGDWHLALAAYNWGEGSVRRAIKRNQAAGRPTDYLSLRMPNETRFYIPKLQAIKNIVAKPSNFGLTLPTLENHPYFLSVGIERDMDVELAARLADMPIAEFKALNPQLNRAVILAAGTAQLLMPYDNANHFVKAVQRHPGPLASWTTWTVPQAMKSADAAKQAGMPESTFLAINHIPPRMIVQAGSTVLVPRAASKQADVSDQLADNASLALAHESPPTRRMLVRVGQGGDSVAAIAKRYRVTSLQVATWNKVSATAKFAVGSSVVLHVVDNGKRTTVVRGAKPVKLAKSRTPRHKAKATRVAVGEAATPLRR